MPRRFIKLPPIPAAFVAALVFALHGAAVAQQDTTPPAEEPAPRQAPEDRPDAAQPAGADQPPKAKVIGPDPDYKPVDRDAVVRRFLEHVRQSERFSDAQKQLVAELAEPIDGRIDEELITTSLMKLYPRFALAMEQLGDERTRRALTTLKKLAESEDPFLAAHARFYQARAHSMAEDFEDALPLLKKLSQPPPGERRLLYGGQTLFFRGVAEAETLNREAAIRTLKTFVEHYPDASERMLVGAMYMIDQLSVMAEGTIYDVQDRMDYSRRRLALIEPGEQTQAEQENIIAILDKLIEEAEQNEQSGGGGAAGGGGGQGQSQGGGGAAGGSQSGGADQSSLPGGGSGPKDLRDRRMSGEDVWSPEREKEREEVINANKDKFPDRYRKLIEQYYKSLQEEN